MRRSRLNKYNQKKNQKTIALSIIGIIIVLFFLFKFGIEMLVNFSLFLSGNKSSNKIINSSQIDFMSPPVLGPLPSATNSALMIISGNSIKNRTIILYINNKNVDQIQSDSNGNFTFSDTLDLGSNHISVKAEYNGKQSDFSNSFDVIYLNSKPTLDVNSPSDNQKFNKNQVGAGSSISVSGKTDPGVKITVNGFWAIIDDNNNFSYSLPLQNGDNQIKIIATDQAGNTSEKDLNVNYSP